MLFDKLQGDDVFSLVTFHEKAKTIIASTYVRDLSREIVEELVNFKFPTGGTIVASGFNEAKANLTKFKAENTLSDNYENRIVMLTDVGDNSVAGE